MPGTGMLFPQEKRRICRCAIQARAPAYPAGPRPAVWLLSVMRRFRREIPVIPRVDPAERAG